MVALLWKGFVVSDLFITRLHCTQKSQILKYSYLNTYLHYEISALSGKVQYVCTSVIHDMYCTFYIFLHIIIGSSVTHIFGMAGSSVQTPLEVSEPNILPTSLIKIGFDNGFAINTAI